MTSQDCVTRISFFSTDFATILHIPQPDRVEYGVEVTVVGSVVSGRQGAGSVDNLIVIVA